MIKLYTTLSLLAIFSIAASATPTEKPLEYIRNQGQWKQPFLYKATTGGGQVYLEKGGFTFVVADQNNKERMHAHRHMVAKNPKRSKDTIHLNFHAYRVNFVGANMPTVESSKLQQHYYNYFLGSNPAEWQSGIHPALAVDYKNVYEGIDLHIASEAGNMKYDFIVQPGSDASQIVLAYSGADNLSLKDGKLLVGTSVGTIEEMKPYVYQYVDGEKQVVPCKYELIGNEVSYVFPRGYDKTQPLIIDPTVVFATFTGSAADNWGFTATYDAQGNFYAGGIVEDNGYPTTTGAYQLTYGGGVAALEIASDIAITKFNPGGTALIYSTYLGGNDNEVPFSMVVDNGGNLVVAGRTFSGNFPTTNLAYDKLHDGGTDIIVTKFNPTGTALVGSTFVGGTDNDGYNAGVFLAHNYGDDARGEVIVDNSGNIYVACNSASTDFPRVNASQTTNIGVMDGVVFKLNPSLTTMLWSTYIGGMYDDAAYVLTLDATQANVYVAGGTESSDFPSTAGTFHPVFNPDVNNVTDGFIAKFQNGGNYARQRVTFIGEDDYDQVYGLQVDFNNQVYAMGQTLSGTFPVTSGTYRNANSSQFVISLDANLTNNLFSTVFGSGDSTGCNISPVAFLVDTCRNIYISGWGGTLANSGSTTAGLPVTANANQSTTEGEDFYFIVLSPNAQNLLYATFKGNSGVGEHVDGGTSRFDKSGVVYQAICGGCGGNGFPTTAGSWSPNNGGTACNLVALKIAFELSAVDAVASLAPDSVGCIPFNVTFTSNSVNATTHSWDFGDGTSSALKSPAHTFTKAGTYKVRLVVHNPNACIAYDTASFNIVVKDNIIKSNFDVVSLDSCGPFRVNYTNNSTFQATAPVQFEWNFGDGGSFNGPNPPQHTYKDTGTYRVVLTLRDNTACIPVDSMVKIVRLGGYRVKAALDIPASLCGLADVAFLNKSENATAYLWNFGDSTKPTVNNTHTYKAPGEYTVTLIATNPASCNKTDTTTGRFKVMTVPVADFYYSPVIPVRNEPVQFVNLSEKAVYYNWNFGDGRGSEETNPNHMYPKTGNYTVCLLARSNDGCADTICRQVPTEVFSVADLPTAFSPNGDGANDVLYVRGAAIESMRLNIYNRWGEMVFESTDQATGWDGTYKGRPQEIDGYAFMLYVRFLDGTDFNKQGNVTLLR